MKMRLIKSIILLIKYKGGFLNEKTLDPLGGRGGGGKVLGGFLRG